MHGPVPQASPPQPQVSHSITSDGTPSVARSAASLWQLHSERSVEPTHSSWFGSLGGVHRVCRTRERCVPAARAGCGAATNSSHAFWHFFTVVARKGKKRTAPQAPAGGREEMGRGKEGTGRKKEGLDNQSEPRGGEMRGCAVSGTAPVLPQSTMCCHKAPLAISRGGRSEALGRSLCVIRVGIHQW